MLQASLWARGGQFAVINSTVFPLFFKPGNNTLYFSCGVSGISGHEDAAVLIVPGLHTLQHHEQEATGTVFCDSCVFMLKRSTQSRSRIMTLTRLALPLVWCHGY